MDWRRIKWNYHCLFGIANLIDVKTLTDKKVLKFSNGVMIQAFRVTGNFTASKMQYINFPEPFLDNNIFISDSLYHTGTHSVICQIGITDNTKIQIFPHANFEISILPTGLFITAIGRWK